jgi:hypothetical protein
MAWGQSIYRAGNLLLKREIANTVLGGNQAPIESIVVSVVFSRTQSGTAMFFLHWLHLVVNEVAATETGSVTKHVQCESCRHGYCYSAQRTGRGEALNIFYLNYSEAKATAKRRARDNLKQKLERAVELFPCPECGWTQQAMLPAAKRKHYRWMSVVGATLTILVLPLGLAGVFLNQPVGQLPFIPWETYVSILVLLFVIGVGFLIGKYFLSKDYQPNTVPDEEWRHNFEKRYPVP